MIGLPANIFYGTGIPDMYFGLKKGREHKENKLFIDASEHFEKAKTKPPAPRTLPRLSTPTESKAEDKYSHVATLEEIRERLQPQHPRYVDTFEEENLSICCRGAENEGP